MTNHLIPLFIMRETGIKVFNTSKVYLNDPNVLDYSIGFPENNFQIPLSLFGMFSYFPTSKLLTQMLKVYEEVYVLIPSKWNPHNNLYTHNESQILD